MSSKKTRVLFTIGSMAGGGAERQMIHYLRYLDRSRYEPALYLHQRQGEFLSQIPEDVPVTAFWDRRRPPRIHVPGRIFALQGRDLAQVLAAQRIDVVCAVTFLASLVADRATRRRVTPWIAIEMADPRLDFFHQVQRFRWLKRWLLTRAYRRADAAVAVSEGCREGMRRSYRLCKERIAVIRNFVDLSEIDRLARLPDPYPSATGFRIVTMGRLDQQKGQIHLLQALDQLVHRLGRTTVRLDILGQGPLEDELKAFVRSRNLEAHVRFVGFLENPFAVIAHCQLFCLPSLYEGLPLALLEGMACRVPVLATDCPSGPHEVLDGGRFGRLVPAGAASKLAAAIADAMDHYPDWTARIPAARLRVEREFSVESELTRLQQLIDKTLEASSDNSS
jgi:glycosyltransferase involved in cell wall biosynthesis